MAAIALNVNFNNLDLPPRVLMGLARANTEPMFDDIGDYLLSETLINFDREQTPEGEPWTPSQRAASTGGKTLQHKGHLRDSYVYDARPDQVEIGSNLIYSAIHHYGGEAGRGGSVEIDPRPALGITPEMENEIGDIAVDFYRRLLP